MMNPIMMMPSRDRYVVQQQCSDVDEFCELIRDWDLDFRQLGVGPLGCDSLQVGSGGIRLTHNSAQVALDQHGMSPTSGHTFGIGARPMDVRWCGRVVDSDDFLAFHPSGEFESVSPGGFEAFTISIDEEVFLARAESLERPDLINEVSKSEFVLRVGNTSAEALRRELWWISDSIRAQPGLIEYPEFCAKLREEIPGEVIRLLSGNAPGAKSPEVSSRGRAVRSAVDFIHDSSDEPIRMEDLCLVAGASERTLQYGFRDRYGVTPKQYIKTHRLNCVRRQLRRADPQDTRISDVAQQWGFWHMGQFACDYRKLFGMLPSATLTSDRAPQPPAEFR
jgi:AraC family ethanolamine operon transcriptional activator